MRHHIPLKTISALFGFLLIMANGFSQLSPKSKQQVKPKPVLTNKVNPGPAKVHDGSMVVVDSIFSKWTPVADYIGATHHNMLSDSKGNVFAFANYDKTGVYQLINASWVKLGENFTGKTGKIFLDANDILYAYVENKVYKLNGNDWLPVWDSEIPKLSFIGMDGQAYRRDNDFDTPLFKWNNGAWEKICEPVFTAHIDKNGRVYTLTSYEDRLKRKESIKYWDGTAWNYMNEDRLEKIEVDRKFLYALTVLDMGPGKSKRIIKRWDGINWVTIPIPYDSTISVNKMNVDQFGNIHLTTSHGEYFSIKSKPFVHVDDDYEIYQNSGKTVIINDQLFDMARTNSKLLVYNPSWTVYNTTLYPIPVKPGVKPSATLTSILSRWKMYKGKYGWGIRTQDRKDVVFAEFDSIRIEEAPEGSHEDISLYMKRSYHEVRCSVFFTDPWKLHGFKEKDMGDCYTCSDGYTGERIETIEKRGEYVEGKTYTTSKPRSSGGYTETTTKEAGYYKPSTYSTKVVGKREKCRTLKCKGGRIMHKQVWSHKTFYTEAYE